MIADKSLPDHRSYATYDVDMGLTTISEDPS